MEQIESARAEAYEAGVIAAKAALDGAGTPILSRDESALGEPERSYALGWNSVWASEENRRRWDRIIPADLSRIVPTVAIGAGPLRSDREVAKPATDTPPGCTRSTRNLQDT
ncbi:hypothetical protein D7S81_21795 [Ralstonia insidiosa]|jgi:hypothetical protein|nr:hypothetical protein [Ralstonia insidiosa]MBA9939241.1 hypothetical protein [Ralstonia insidiosa]